MRMLDELLLQKLANWRPEGGRQTLAVSDTADASMPTAAASQRRADAISPRRKACPSLRLRERWRAAETQDGP